MNDDGKPGAYRPPEPIEEMAGLLAQHTLVPFFGAGISRPHLGFDAGELAKEMAREIGVSEDTPLSQVSDLFVEKNGEEAFISHLRQKLVVKELDDSKVMTHVLLVSLCPSLLYTTNQDNLFELVAAKYGRPYRRVVTTEDISDASPGERLLYKFHGDTDVPDSLVFGAKSYQARIAAEDHPLDIRLRSDLLGKRLLFLGYSIRDENVAKLLALVKRAFAGKLPQSYLVAFDYDPSMAHLANEYGIRVIDPKLLYPDAATNAEAFGRCLKDLCDETVKLQARKGLDDLFSGGTFNPRVITDHEMRAVEKAIVTEPFDSAVNAFRGEFDLTVVPEHLQDRGVAAFKALVDKADPKDLAQMDALKAVLFNFRMPPYRVLDVMAHLMASCNKRPAKQGFDDYVSLICTSMPDDTLPVAAACAVAMLRERKEPITDNFRALAQSWFRGYDGVHEDMRERVESMMHDAWSDQRNIPIPQRRGAGPFEPKGFHAIHNQFTSHLPKALRGPDE